MTATPRPYSFAGNARTWAVARFDIGVAKSMSYMSFIAAFVGIRACLWRARLADIHSVKAGVQLPLPLKLHLLCIMSIWAYAVCQRLHRVPKKLLISFKLQAGEDRAAPLPTTITTADTDQSQQLGLPPLVDDNTVQREMGFILPQGIYILFAKASGQRPSWAMSKQTDEKGLQLGHVREHNMHCCHQRASSPLTCTWPMASLIQEQNASCTHVWAQRSTVKWLQKHCCPAWCNGASSLPLQKWTPWCTTGCT